MKRVDVPTLRAAWWTMREVRRLDKSLSRSGITGAAVTSPPALPDEAGRGVAAVLRRRNDTCLVRALVLQAWHQSQGRSRDVIIGVTAPGDDFRAHAWLDGDDPCHWEGFTELTRRPATS